MDVLQNQYEVVVVGGGHAGIEAAAAAARLGCRVLLVTHNKDKIGELSCNPAIGGVGKGQLVKEVDALGGLMGELADVACIQYRRLNTTRGAAVQSTRMQVDMDLYRAEAQKRLRKIAGLQIAEDEVVDILCENETVAGVRLKRQGRIQSDTVVLTPGTFFHGLIHMGQRHFSGGRIGDESSEILPDRLQAMGFQFGRFKTGTTPRLDKQSIRYDQFIEQPGDEDFSPFSFRSPSTPKQEQTACYIGSTNPATHAIIRDNLDRSALYSGQITGTGVRYCPSIEDKIVKFAGRESHHVFIEPEGLRRETIYPNGTSNSLPEDVQETMIRSIRGLEDAVIVQPGYGIEHDYILPTQLKPTLETRKIRGLFFAGQINGTTGYEEAAAQGLVAGINAAKCVRHEASFTLDRSQAYIGVLIDDLVTKGTNEPYRMFTSRVEYRLVIREDNADERLTPLGYALGLIGQKDYDAFKEKEAAVLQEEERLRQTRLPANDKSNAVAKRCDTTPFQGSFTLLEFLRRPQLGYRDLMELDEPSQTVPKAVRERVEVKIKYAGYIEKQAVEIEKFKHLEKIKIPEGFTYAGLPGISLEVAEKLTAFQPLNLGQAGRISGITPGALSQLMFHISKFQAGKKNE